MLKVEDIMDMEFGGIDHSDLYDYSDALCIAATWKDGRDLTEQELDELNDEHSLFVYEKLMKKLY